MSWPRTSRSRTEARVAGLSRSEKIFLERLTSDLRTLGVPGLVLANFFPPINPYQIDFLIVTSGCACHVELKNVTVPVLGGINGPWMLQLLDGSRRPLDAKNPYRQALDAKFAISDQMHAFANSDDSIPQLPKGRKFYTAIESVVCVFPELLPRSSVYSDHKVGVLGYRDLIHLLTTRKTNPGWTTRQWLDFAMHLGMVRVHESINLTQPELRAGQETVAAYVRRFESFYGADLPAFVQTPIVGDNGVLSSETLMDSLMSHEHVQLIGQSGYGKSLLVKHLALFAVRGGRLPIIAAARNYDGKLSLLLDRSVAHLHADSALVLMQLAQRVGWPAVLCLDGFNECPRRLQEKLIKDLHAFALRWPARLGLSLQRTSR